MRRRDADRRMRPENVYFLARMGHQRHAYLMKSASIPTSHVAETAPRAFPRQQTHPVIAAKPRRKFTHCDDRSTAAREVGTIVTKQMYHAAHIDVTRPSSLSYMN